MTFHRARITRGRDEVAYGLHASAFEHFLSPGIDRDELLSKIGFRRTPCPFTQSNDSYCLPVSEDFDLGAFAAAFERAFDALHEADRAFDRCGFFLESRDFPAKHWMNTQGDGHSGAVLNRFDAEDTEDENFRFIFTWVGRSQGEGGWTTHIRAKEQPLSPELQAAFTFLGLKQSEQCIQFDFEPCYWRNVRRETWGNSPFDGNNDTAFGWFRALPQHFSPGLHRLLDAEKELSAFGFSLLPRALPAASGRSVRSRATVDARATSRSAAPQPPPEVEEDFDVAISYAGPDREHAEGLASILNGHGIKVFYDRFYRSSLWGKDLPAYFDRIYRQSARFCVMFISEAYRDRAWTILERRSALARMVEERGREYILPVVVQPVDLDGLPPTIGNLALDEFSIEEIAQTLMEKLQERRARAVTARPTLAVEAAASALSQTRSSKKGH